MARHAHRHMHQEVHIIGTVQGYVPDGHAVARLLEEAWPAVVALGVPPEDLEGLRHLDLSDEPASLIGRPAPRGKMAPAGAPGLEGILGLGRHAPPTEDDDAPFAALDPLSQRFLALLEEHGEVALPSPDLQTAYAWARQHDRPVQPLDLDDESHAEVYIRANRLRDVWRSGRIHRRLAAASFDAQDADALALAWDRFQNRMPSLQAVEAAREEHMAQRLQEVVDAAAGAVVAVVPLARLEGVVARLGT